MSTAAEILVIIVSVVLTVFLIISIILGIYLIRLSAEIRKIAKSAQSTVDHIDATVRGVGRLVSPAFIVEMVNRFIKKYQKKEK